MPTISDPEIKEGKPQLVTPELKQPELFAAEIEMEGKSSEPLPHLFCNPVSSRGRWDHLLLRQGRQTGPDPAGRDRVDQRHPEGPGAAAIRFSTGLITSNVNEKPTDPHYPLLTKAGILATKKKSWNSITSEMTPSDRNCSTASAAWRRPPTRTRP